MTLQIAAKVALIVVLISVLMIFAATDVEFVYAAF